MVEIIPKAPRKIPAWQKALAYFLFSLPVILLASYLVLSYLQGNSQEQLQGLEEKLVQAETEEIKALETEVLGYKERIEDFTPLLEEHTLSSKFFTFLEEKTHPQVSFSFLNLSTQNFTASLQGKTNSFTSLGQQLLIFREDPLVESSNLSSIGLAKGGGVEFSLTLILKKNLFRY